MSKVVKFGSEIEVTTYIKQYIESKNESTQKLLDEKFLAIMCTIFIDKECKLKNIYIETSFKVIEYNKENQIDEDTLQLVCKKVSNALVACALKKPIKEQVSLEQKFQKEFTRYSNMIRYMHFNPPWKIKSGYKFVYENLKKFIEDHPQFDSKEVQRLITCAFNGMNATV